MEIETSKLRTVNHVQDGFARPKDSLYFMEHHGATMKNFLAQNVKFQFSTLFKKDKSVVSCVLKKYIHFELHAYYIIYLFNDTLI